MVEVYRARECNHLLGEPAVVHAEAAHRFSFHHKHGPSRARERLQLDGVRVRQGLRRASAWSAKRHPGHRRQRAVIQELADGARTDGERRTDRPDPQDERDQ